MLGSKGLRSEHLLRMKELFDSIIASAGKDPADFYTYWRKEAENIYMQVADLPSDEAFEKAMGMIETSARFELVRRDVVRNLLG
ncbi:MAG: hypothetical protein RMJ59_02375 [Candidatus Nitrosocaldus sp.]|nr:hypothetical protein [Candidatus Nitrosocaldus sp.]MDW8275213.1 hypothetical protein [Candidatus Nitrosocaldus sp.]